MTPDDVDRVDRLVASAVEDPLFTADFYARLFAGTPELRALFPDDLTSLREKFASELSVLASALRDLDSFEPRARRLGARHAGYGVRARHYDLVRDALIGSFRRRDGAGFDAADERALELGFNLVAEVMQEGAASSRPTVPE